MTIFEEAKSKLNIVDVAESYGLQIDRYGKASCPFHDDSHPSLGFKNERFKCFACGTGGDVISLAQGLLGLSTPLEAVKKLNADFHLGLNIDKTQNQQNINEFCKDKNLLKAFKMWEKVTFLQLANLHRLLLSYRRNFAPKSPDDEPNEQFVMSLQMLDYIDYLCEILRIGTFEEKVKLYKDWGKISAK